MQELVRSTILAYGLIAPGDTVVVGLSGGPDSVALLHALLSLGPQMGFGVRAAHLNHCIRGEAADRDEAFVRELCEFYGVPLQCKKVDVPALAKEKGWTMEQAGREARYAFLQAAAKELGANKIAVAHHMDDQAESILLHLTRGSGLTGLIGMTPMRGNVIRPLLGVRRFEVEEYLTREGLAWCVDATNLETGGTRNRLRLDVIPYIQAHINPAFVESLCSMSELLLRDERYLSSLAGAALEAARREGGYDRAALAGEPLPILTRALRMAIAEAGGADIERVHVEGVTELLTGRTGARVQLPNDLEARASYGLLQIGRAAPAAAFELPLVFPGVVETPLGRLTMALCKRPARFGEEPNVSYLDADALNGAVVRSRRDGDKIFPVGAPGRKKLKEYFIDRKVPREKRALPILCRDDDVLLLPGFCTGEAARVTEKTTRVLRVEYSNA